MHHASPKVMIKTTASKIHTQTNSQAVHWHNYTLDFTLPRHRKTTNQTTTRKQTIKHQTINAYTLHTRTSTKTIWLWCTNFTCAQTQNPSRFETFNSSWSQGQESRLKIKILCDSVCSQIYQHTVTEVLPSYASPVGKWLNAAWEPQRGNTPTLITFNLKQKKEWTKMIEYLYMMTFWFIPFPHQVKY